MNPIKLNYLVDTGMGICFVAAALTGIIKFPGLIFRFGLTYKDLPMQTISLIHDWSGIMIVILVGVHLALHWRWIVCVTKSFFKKEDKKCEK